MLFNAIIYWRNEDRARPYNLEILLCNRYGYCIISAKFVKTAQKSSRVDRNRAETLTSIV